MEWEVLIMTFDLVELLQYLDLHGSTAIIAIMTMFICWVLFSSSNIANKIRIKVIEGFSMASSSIHTDKERLAEQISADIDEVLEHLQTETKADNVLVVRFRNGSYDSVGNSILKFFASNEKAKPGYLQIGDKIQNISRSLYGTFCDTLIKEKKIYIKDRDSIDHNKAELIGLMNLFGNANRFYARALITTRGNQHVGFICAVYKEPHRISEEKLDVLLSDACARVVGKIEMENLSATKNKKKKRKDKSESDTF
jgi:hypothetical protein